MYEVDTRWLQPFYDDHAPIRHRVVHASLGAKLHTGSDPKSSTGQRERMGFPTQERTRARQMSCQILQIRKLRTPRKLRSRPTSS